MEVDEKWADFQSKRFFIGWVGLGGPLHCGPFAEGDEVRLGRGDGACLSDENGERQSRVEMPLEDAEHTRG